MAYRQAALSTPRTRGAKHAYAPLSRASGRNAAECHECQHDDVETGYCVYDESAASRRTGFELLIYYFGIQRTADGRARLVRSL